jgi:thioredoxin reductase (NADPH)
MAIQDVIIIGAGPSGLSAAIAAKQQNLDYQVFEQGVLVNSIGRFPPQMVFFTTPELLEIGGLPFVSPYEKPTRVEALKYYRKVVDAFDLRIAFGEKVLAVAASPGASMGSEGAIDPAAPEAEAPRFAVSTRSKLGGQRVHHARNVIFAIGYYDHPVLIGVPGEAMAHVRHDYAEPYPHYRQNVVVVGGGNSAAESALELFRAGAHVTLVHRSASLKSGIKYWVRPDIENRIKEGSIAARFNACVTEIRQTSVLVRSDGPGGPGGAEELPADAVYLLTGYRADTDLMVRAGVVLDGRDAPVHDPQTFETNVPGLFVAGGAIAGVDTDTIFIENGRFHGDRIIEAIASRSR